MAVAETLRNIAGNAPEGRTADERGAGDRATSERDLGAPSTIGRLLFGGALAFSAFNALRSLEGQIQYAESKGVPFADKLVPFATGLLAFGSIGIAIWRLPALAAASVATFLAAITPTMHDFWNAEEEQKQNEQIQFVKNVGLLGGAVAFLKRALRE